MKESEIYGPPQEPRSPENPTDEELERDAEVIKKYFLGVKEGKYDKEEEGEIVTIKSKDGEILYSGFKEEFSQIEQILSKKEKTNNKTKRKGVSYRDRTH